MCMTDTMERQHDSGSLKPEHAIPAKKLGGAVVRGIWRASTSKWGKRGVGLAIVAATSYAGASHLLESEAESQAADRQSEENRLIDNMRTSGVQLDNSLVILHEGVKYRSTPHQVASKSEFGITLKKSNIEGEVAPGDVLIIERLVETKVNDSGQKWGAFRLKEPTSDKAQLPEEIAQDYVWINLGSLNQQNKSRKEPLIEAYILPNQPETYQGSDSITTVMAPNGLLSANEIDRPLAIGRVFNEQDVDALLEMVNLNPVDN